MLYNIPLANDVTYIYIFNDLTSKSSIESFIEKNFIFSDFVSKLSFHPYYWSSKNKAVLLISNVCLLDIACFSKTEQSYEESAVKQNRVITLTSQYFLNHILFFNAYPENPIPEFILDV